MHADRRTIGTVVEACCEGPTVLWAADADFHLVTLAITGLETGDSIYAEPCVRF